MPKRSRSDWLPLTFDGTEVHLAKIQEARRKLSLSSSSEVVRAAIAGFDFTNYDAKRPAHRQISIRLAPELREKLRKCGRRKNVSIGELLRVALDNLVTPGKTAQGSRSKAMSKKNR